MPANKLPIIIALLAVTIFLSGCVEPAACGNGVCEASETSNTCPEDCGISEVHFECKDLTCAEVTGPGPSTCATDLDCEVIPETHTECEAEQCISVDGSGSDQCQADSDCVIGTHFECNGTRCVEIAGVGSHECSFDTDCISATSTFSSNLESSPSAPKEFVLELDNTDFPHLTNETRTYRYVGTTYATNMKETIGINADAKMDLTDKDVEDLVVYMNGEGDFNYVLDLGEGIPVYNDTTESSEFIDGDNDNIVIPFLGEEYTVQEIDVDTGTLKLIKQSQKTTYYESEKITGLKGRGIYNGETLSAEVNAITMSGATATNYNARFLLFDSKGNEIGRQTLGPGVYLSDNFVDPQGDYSLKTVVYISSIGIEATTSKGYVTAVVGKGTVYLKHNEAFPYDPTDTSPANDYWKANLDMTGSDDSPNVRTLTKITIKNAVKKWNSVNPLYSENSSLTQAAPVSTAMFLEGNDEDDLGYGFVRINFEGFEESTEPYSETEVSVGRGQCKTNEGQEAGCILYTDASGVEREVPFYIKLELTTGPSDESEFHIDDQRFYYRCDTMDINVGFADGNNLNGKRLNIHSGIRDLSLYTDWWRGSDGKLYLEGPNACSGIGKTCSDDIGAVFADMSVSEKGDDVVAMVFDGNCQFANQSFNNYTYADGTILTAISSNGNKYKRNFVTATPPAYETMFYDDDNTTFDKAWGLSRLGVTNTSLNDTYGYIMYVNDESSYKDVYLLLDGGSTILTNEYSKVKVEFNGTDYQSQKVFGGNRPFWAHDSIGENGFLPYRYGTKYDPQFYAPDHRALGEDPADTSFNVANITIGLGDFDNNIVNTFIDTAVNELIALPNSELSYYTDQVYIEQFDSGLRSDNQATQSNATWIDDGSKVEIITTDSMGDYVKVTTPKERRKVSIRIEG
ncbi:MAG: hypothetical protein QGI60_05055 [archaeon]|nr:hypothetical protein [archaeon]